jgi:tRNA threonylcarbamoyl adenosine modification protein YjeE
MEWILPDEAATQALAVAAAQAMPASESPLVIYLQGDLGTGKTSFARGMLQALGETGPVRSPTYGLVSEYPLRTGHVVHIDLYRLVDPSELENLGLRDLLAGSSLWLIEWPEKGEGRLPKPDATLHWLVQGGGRLVRLKAFTETGQQWLACLPAGPVS